MKTKIRSTWYSTGWIENMPCLKAACVPANIKVGIICMFLLVACKQDRKVVNDWPVSFGFGRTATEQEIARLDIDIHTDGKGLPEGKGNAISGKQIYTVK